MTPEPKQEIKKLSELIRVTPDKNFKIPSYQRPYKWQYSHVVRLLDDIFEHVVIQKKIYRIGNVILHKENKDLNIVDGQQRLTTISILLNLLDHEQSFLLSQNYKHRISKENIVHNYKAIDTWLSKIPNRTDFKNEILESCEFVVFTVYSQDEAFQLFDSQNARGKELEPSDLLKAFHLREMQFDSEEERIKCVKRWEEAIDQGNLKPILGNHLFRIRKWSRNEALYNFTKNEIDEFKGISLHQKQAFPYEQSLRMLDGFIDNAQKDKFLKNTHIAQEYPFSITMPIINGKRFFEYVDFYIERKRDLLESDNYSEFRGFYREYCEKYWGWWRSGDEKVRNLYENILLLFIDRFGCVEDFEDYYKAFYKSAYQIRCNFKSIRLETILNSETRKIIQEINDALIPARLKTHQFKEYQVAKELANGVDFIATAIENNFVKNGTT